LIAFGLTTFVVACGDKVITNTNLITTTDVFSQTNLVSDAAGLGAVTVDPQLINPWGIAFGSTGLLWVANNGSGVATIYDQSGAKQGLTVTIPPATAAATALTGVVFNGTTDFNAFGTPATFLFADENSSLAAWNPPLAAMGASGVFLAPGATTASYKGIALGVEGGVNRLYATDFHNGYVVEWDAGFNFVRTFTDASIPAGYAPFGIANIGGQLYVSYAKQLAPADVDEVTGVGNGFVDVFNTDGTLVRRFASNGVLDAPWGMVQAPAGFGPFGGDILIGNFGNGQIGAYDPGTGAFIDWLRDASGNPIANSGLWGLAFGPSPNGSSLFFAAGIGNELHGLVGVINQVTP
jgi:uncharacterized protein (TIGR03118 family)